MRKSQHARARPYVILLIGFGLRLFRLGAESLWYDETVSLLLARSDLGEITRHTAGDIHPPFYYYLLHFWGEFTGWSEFSSAFLSLLFGVLIIALVYRLSQEWLTFPINSAPASWPGARGGLGVALVASSLIAISPFNVWYSQEVRMYTLGAALGLLSVHYLRRMLTVPDLRLTDLVAYVTFTALGIYTLYYFAFLLLFEYLYVAVLLAAQWSDRRQSSQRLSPVVKRFAASQLAIAILYLPWLPTAFRQATDPPVPPWRDLTPLPNMLGESFSALVLGQSVEPTLAAPFLLLVLALILYLFFRQDRERRKVGTQFGLTSSAQPPVPLGTPLTDGDSRFSLQPQRSIAIFLLSYSLIPLLAIFVLSLWKPLYHVRYVFTYSPGFYILLALAICFAARHFAIHNLRLQVCLAIAATIVYAFASSYSLNNYWFDSRYADDDLRGAVQGFAANWHPGDVILVNAGYAYPALLYYYPSPFAQLVRLVDYAPSPGDANVSPIVLMTGSIGGSPHLGWGDPRSDFYATDAKETTAALNRVFRSHPRVWVLRIYDTVTDPTGIIRKFFSEQGRIVEDTGFTGESNVRLQAFLTGSIAALPDGATKLDARLADRVTLLGFESSPLQKRRGEAFDVTLYWMALRTLDVNYQLSLQLFDAQGNLIAQHDETPLGDALPTSRWRSGEIYPEPVRVFVPASIMPGEYTVIVKLYALNSGEVLGVPVRIATLTVGP